MARDGNSFKSFDPWRDFSNTNKGEAPGTSLTVIFHCDPAVKALTEIPPMAYRPDDLLHFLTPSAREQHGFTGSDVGLLEQAFAKVLKLPMPADKKLALEEKWATYRASKEQKAEEPAPAVA